MNKKIIMQQRNNKNKIDKANRPCLYELIFVIEFFHINIFYDGMFWKYT